MSGREHYAAVIERILDEIKSNQEYLSTVKLEVVDELIFQATSRPVILSRVRGLNSNITLYKEILLNMVDSSANKTQSSQSYLLSEEQEIEYAELVEYLNELQSEAVAKNRELKIHQDNLDRALSEQLILTSAITNLELELKLVKSNQDLESNKT